MMKNKEDIINWNDPELEFLPAALEITERPPSPLGRIIIWMIISFFLIALLWALIGKVDEVAAAPGKVIPSGYTKIVQAEDKGIVHRIHVANGTRVKRGDVLIELDTTMTTADLSLLQKERDALVLELERLRAEKAGSGFSPSRTNDAPLESAQQKELFKARTGAYTSRLGTLDQRLFAARAAMKNAQSQLEKYQAFLPIVTEQKEHAQTLFEDGKMSLIERNNYLQKEIEVRQSVIAHEAEVERNRHIVRETKEEKRRVTNEWNAEISTKILENEKSLKSLRKEIAKTEEKERLSRIVSPADGVVQQLEIHTVGAILAPAQPLMLIVPEDGPIEFEIWIENKDIGFIQVNQPIEIKVETFNFQKYGTLDGSVSHIANEAREDNKMGLVYQAVVTASQDYYMIAGEKRRLLPGMAVTGEIKIRQKRVIEYFLDTFRKYRSESLRERG